MQLSRASILIAPLSIIVLFAPALVGDQRLAFRDVSHFYTPLYDYVAARTADQWLPLWNPLDQTGIPLLGETTTAVLYPVRYLLFALPISTETAIAWYVALHLVLASLTAGLAARWAGIRPLACSLVGIVYSLSGSVLFLYTNPPFLVGCLVAAGVGRDVGETTNRYKNSRTDRSTSHVHDAIGWRPADCFACHDRDWVVLPVTIAPPKGGFSQAIVGPGSSNLGGFAVSASVGSFAIVESPERSNCECRHRTLA